MAAIGNDQMKRLTVPLDETSRLASASTAMIVAISLTSVFVSRALVDFDRNWESFARTQGCLDTCTLAGRAVAITTFLQEKRERSREKRNT